jgi:hypothetical protein
VPDSKGTLQEVLLHYVSGGYVSQEVTEQEHLLIIGKLEGFISLNLLFLGVRSDEALDKIVLLDFWLKAIGTVGGLLAQILHEVLAEEGQAWHANLASSFQIGVVLINQYRIIGTLLFNDMPVVVFLFSMNCCFFIFMDE